MAGKLLDLPEILERHADGGKVSPKEAQAVTAAAAGMRRQFLKDAWETLPSLDPSSPKFAAFKECMRSMGETLVQHGIISGDEMQGLWIAIERVQ